MYPGMANRRKQKRKPAKRGPKKERLIITGERAAGLRKLLEVNIKDLKQRFDAAHRKGMEALEAGDNRAFVNAINEEKKLIDQLPSGRDVIKPTRKDRK